MPSWRSASPISPGSRVCHKHTNLMKIIDIQWHMYRLPFLHTFHTAHGVMDTREGMIVQVTTNEGITGIGEIAPLPTFNGGSLADACSLLPALAGHLDHTTIYEALELLAAEKVHTKNASTLCGLEIALLDVLGRATNCGVSALLSPADFTPRAAVPVNAVICSIDKKQAAEPALYAKKKQ